MSRRMSASQSQYFATSMSSPVKALIEILAAVAAVPVSFAVTIVVRKLPGVSRAL